MQNKYGEKRLSKAGALRRGRTGMSKSLVGWLMMALPTLLFLFYVWVPILENVYLSFFSAKGMKIQEFVGLENYAKVLRDPNFEAALRNTFMYTLSSLLIGFLVPIVMAIIISEIVHGRGFMRFSVYFPNIVPGLATIFIWGYFFAVGADGVLNIILGYFGIDPLSWLTNRMFTIPLIIVTMTWKSAGSTALIYMACISGINPELYEAAAIDGAGLWKRIWHVTIPAVFKLGKTLLILQIISVFQIMYEPIILTNGGPNRASISLMQMVWTYAFKDTRYPRAAALSVMICLVLILLSGLYNILTKDREDSVPRRRRRRVQQ